MAEKMLSKTGFVVIGQTSGHTVIAKDSLLTRLNYFDGKFLRAPDLKLEQQALLSHVYLSNQAGGSGVVHGYDCTLTSGDRLHVGTGLAIDPQGRVLQLPEEINVGIADLIEKSRVRNAAIKSTSAAAKSASEFDECTLRVAEEPGEVLAGSDLYLITVGHAESYCGEEDVYGKLCEEACISSTERPYIVEGIVIRAVPLNLSTLLPTSSAVPLSQVHLRSRVASAYFEQEREISPASHISGAGLASTIWCLGADATSGRDVPIALLARSGSTTGFLDAWIARRERMESPSRHYWAWRMAMRPWNVFLAQVLQFQCQLAQCFRGGVDKPPHADPCEDEREVITTAAKTIKSIQKQYELISVSIANAVAIGGIPGENVISIAELNSLQEKLTALEKSPVNNRYLINCGIVELPSAGYLPVSPIDTMTVNEQVRRMMGEGVDLRFCIVRPDYVPHALEEAQHMERISLLEGLDDPEAKPNVDILVPDGVLKAQDRPVKGNGYAMYLDISSSLIYWAVSYQDEEPGGSLAGLRAMAGFARDSVQVDRNFAFYGAGRGEALSGGGEAFYYAGAILAPTRQPDVKDRITEEFHSNTAISAVRPSVVESDIVRISADSNATVSNQAGVWVDLKIDRDPFAMSISDTCLVNAEIVFAYSSYRDLTQTIVIKTNAILQILEAKQPGAEAKRVRARLSGTANLERKSSQKSDRSWASIPINNEVWLRQGEKLGLLFTLASMLGPTMFGPSVRSIQALRTWQDSTHAQVDIGVSLYKNQNAALKEAAIREVIVTSDDSSIDQQLAKAQQTVDNNVALADHPAHDASILSLDAMASALGDENFASSRAQLLFPAIGADESTSVMQATRDWVLFHRRRDKQCHIEAPVKPEALLRPYRVFLITLQGREDVEKLQKIIGARDWASLQRFSPKVISRVEFAAGTPTLRTSADALRSDWQLRVNAETEILYGAASNRDVWRETTTLAESRLTRLTTIVDDVNELADDASFEALSEIPAGLGVANDEGIVLYAVASIASTCQRVFRLPASDSPDEIVEKLKETLETTSVDVGGVFKEFQSVEVGHLLFRAQTDTPVSNVDAIGTLKTRWQDAGNGEISHVLSLTEQGMESSDIDDSAKQSNRVATVLGGSEFNEIRASTPASLRGCWGITALLPVANRTNNVFYYRRGVVPAGSISDIVRKISADGLSLESTGPWTKLLDIQFNASNNKPVPDDLESLKRIVLSVSPSGENADLTVISVSPKESADGDLAKHKEQTAVIRDAINGRSEFTQTRNGSDDFPDGAEAVTLVVSTDKTRDFTVVPVMVAAEGQPVNRAQPEAGFRFTPDNELIKDDDYKRRITKLKERGIKFRAMELAREKRGRAEDVRLTALFEAFKEESLLAEDAGKKVLRVPEDQRDILDFGAFKVSDVIVLRRA